MQLYLLIYLFILNFILNQVFIFIHKFNLTNITLYYLFLLCVIVRILWIIKL